MRLRTKWYPMPYALYCRYYYLLLLLGTDDVDDYYYYLKRECACVRACVIEEVVGTLVVVLGEAE